MTEAEQRLMEVLWGAGAASVGEVAGGLPKQKAVAYNTVLTTLRILEQKGYVRHEKQGRAFVYRPVVGREEARRGAVRHLLNRFFQNSPGQLVLNILEHERIDPRELERLKKLIEESK